ncbi:MAG: TolC family protein, partial [Muribaculaceae bacterium]|nr:TolC family protein [Muribaculaceae bacterium]
IIAGNTLDGPITYEVPPINKNINYWWIGLNISYNFSSLYKTNKKRLRNKLELSRLSDKQEATEADVDRNIEQAYTLYTQAHEMLATQLKNVELATENYRIVNKRFTNQLALLTDMLDASTAKLDAETRLVNAKINTLYYYYQLKFISGIL